MSLLGLANQTLTTACLMPFIQRYRDQIPADVRNYVNEVFRRNLKRNDRLATQLEETVLAINARGVTPTLLKGAAMLATGRQLDNGIRMMSDLDIMVSPDEIAETRTALAGIGYSTHFEASPEDNKWYADLKRPTDVGMLDLHRSLPGPAFFYPPAAELKQYFSAVRIGRAEAHVPSATFHALIMVIHDQIQDSDYWLGNIDLRHLLNFRDLSLSSEGIDWDTLMSLTPDKLAQHALETQLQGLSELLGVDIPAISRCGPISRIQFARRLAQARFPVLRKALLALALLDHRNYRTGLGEWHRGNGENNSRRHLFPKEKNIRYLVELAGRQRAGKV